MRIDQVTTASGTLSLSQQTPPFAKVLVMGRRKSREMTTGHFWIQLDRVAAGGFQICTCMYVCKKQARPVAWVISF